MGTEVIERETVDEPCRVVASILSVAAGGVPAGVGAVEGRLRDLLASAEGTHG